MIQAALKTTTSALGSIAQTASDHSAIRRSGDIRVSFEFFPPKSSKMETRLWETVAKLEPLQPDFVSVTYGAGGSTKARTRKTVERMVKETSLTPAAHLTCVDATRDEIDEIAQGFWDSGVRHIVALRGDSPNGIDAKYTPTPGGYAYSEDLIKGLKKTGDFEISVSGYPERHPESPNWDVELDTLRRKIDAGADRVITQFFFSPDTFCQYRDRVADAGMDIPVVAGVMLQPDFNGLARMSKMCGVVVPDWYRALFEDLDDDVTTRTLLTASLASDLTAELYKQGVSDFHYYTLNRAELVSAVGRVLGLHHRRKVTAG